MKWAYVLYVLYSFESPDLTERQTADIISWGLPFNAMWECVSFYNRYKPDIMTGAETHIIQKHNDSAEIEEAGCVKVFTDGDNTKKGEKVMLYTK